MEDKKQLNLFVLLFNGLFTAVCVCLLAIVFLQGETTVWQDIEIIADIVACAVALIYLIEGYSKGVAHKYKLLMLSATINALAVTVLAIGEKTQLVSVIMCATAFLLMCVLTFTKDLGKKNSYLYSGLLILIRLAGLISNIAMSPEGLPIINIVLLVSQLSLALLIATAVSAKYLDKALRKNK